MDSSLCLSALGAEFCSLRYGLPAFDAEMRAGRMSSIGGRLDCRHYSLRHRHSGSEADSHSSGAPWIGRRDRECLRGFKLGIAAKIARHARPDALIHHLLQLIWQRDAFDDELVQAQDPAP